MAEPVKIDIWGSCISRDTFTIGNMGVDDPRFQIVNYIRSCSFPVQFTKHELPDVTVADFDSLYPSNAERKWACADMNKSVAQTLNQSGSEWLILDSRVVGYGIYKAESEDGRSELITGILPVVKTNLKPYGVQFSIEEVNVTDPSVMDGLVKFVEWAIGRYGKKIIMIEVAEAFDRIDYDGTLSADLTNMDFTGIIRNIKNETFFEKYLYEHTQCYVVRAPRMIAADLRHKWGYSAVHYISEYYEYALSAIHTIISGQNDPALSKNLNNLYADASYKIAQIICGDIQSEHNTLERAIDSAKLGKINEAFVLLDEMDKQGAILSNVYRGRIYRDAIGIDRDLEKAASCMRSAIERGAIVAVGELFDILWRIDTPDALKEAKELAEMYAEKGDGNAMGRMGRAYRDGKGVEKDLNKAAEWMRKAANQNLGWATWELFDILWRIGTPTSYEEMITLARPLAESGNRELQGRMARAYRDGRGVDRDLNTAAEWMRKAANQNLGWAKNELFDILIRINTPQSSSEAFTVAKTFAESGDVGAMGRLGRAYRDGKGVEKDLNKAAEWMRKAADKDKSWSVELYDVMRLHNLGSK